MKVDDEDDDADEHYDGLLEYDSQVDDAEANNENHVAANEVSAARQRQERDGREEGTDETGEAHEVCARFWRVRQVVAKFAEDDHGVHVYDVDAGKLVEGGETDGNPGGAAITLVSEGGADALVYVLLLRLQSLLIFLFVLLKAL